MNDNWMVSLARCLVILETNFQKNKRRIILISTAVLTAVILVAVIIIFINNRNRMTFVFDDKKTDYNSLSLSGSGYINIGTWATYYSGSVYGERDYTVSWSSERLYELQKKYEIELEEEVFSFVNDSKVQLDIEKQEIIIFMDNEKYEYDLKIIDEDKYGYTEYAITTQSLSKKKFKNDMFERIMYVSYDPDEDTVTLYLNYNSDDDSFTSKLYDEASEMSFYHFTIYNGFFDDDVDCWVKYELDD